jgi:hypothetical protein
MAQPLIQSSFNSGEWAPNLWARTDIEKYHSGAALLRNFFVDYRGGASTRPGTKYCLRGYKDSSAIRMIPFQVTLTLGFACEFGQQYIRFYQNGAPILEAGLAITGITNAKPAVVSVMNTYNTGSVDWVYISGVAGMTQINGGYYVIQTATSGALTLYDLFGNEVDATGWGVYTAGGTTQRVYTIASPYAAGDLALVKFAQNVDLLILCHPSYPPQVLTYNGTTSWTINPIVFGTAVAAPIGLAVSTTLSAGATNYSYAITAVDNAGEESALSTPIALASVQDLAEIAGTNTITWDSVTGATSYNVYKTLSTTTNPVPTGVPYGYIGNVTGTTMADSNITPDFTQGPPVIQTPFVPGAGVLSYTVGTHGSYSTIPTVVVGSPSAGGTQATAAAILGATSVTLNSHGIGNIDITTNTSTTPVGTLLNFPNGQQLLIEGATLISSGGGDWNWEITSVTINSPGYISTGTPPSNPVVPTGSSASNFHAFAAGYTYNFIWGVVQVVPLQDGSGYLTPPSVVFGSGAATATAVLGPSTSGYPAVPAFFQQRLVLAGPSSAPQTFFMSQPGRYYNFNISNPVQDDDAITGTIISGQLNSIKSMVNQPAGLIILTDGSSWLVNGGSFGAAVTPAAIVANAQSFNGANDMPPIVVVFDMLYTQSKGSVVRDSLYNFYANVYTGTDISILASHLFYSYQLKEWAFAEEPFKLVWAVRNDGTLLCLTFLKEQDFIAWTHSDTTGGLFNSVCTTVETVPQGNINATYFAVARTINGTSVQYIERLAERYFTNGVNSAWTVDCGIQYNGSPATNFQGAQFLAGKTCTGLADGVIIPNFVMPVNGEFTLSTAASTVTVGLAYLPQLQTLYIDAGNPTIQGKQKKIPKVTIRVVDTLGLQIGSTFSTMTPMKDFIIGNVGSLLNQVVTGLVTGDGQTLIDPMYTEQGQYCIEQPYPFPATILGVIPELAVGNTQDARSR